MHVNKACNVNHSGTTFPTGVFSLDWSTIKDWALGFLKTSPIPERVFPFCLCTVGVIPMPGRKIRDTVVEDVIPNTYINLSIRI